MNRPGSFAAFGSLAPVLPGLEINGVGQVAFPLTEKQAKEIRKRCQQAPYGKGEQTLVDTTVRRVWTLRPDKFQLSNPEWHDFLSGIVKSVEKGLGLDEHCLKPEIHDLLLYEKGSFFLPHKDGEKIDRMVATLVVVLPSSFTGGELIVRHDGQEEHIDFGSQPGSRFQAHYAAFYADCEHEVLPMREGFRLCLVYNLALDKPKRSKRPIRAPRNKESIDSIGRHLQKWCTTPDKQDPDKILVKLEHKYSKNGLAWDTLKGVDRTRAFALREAARKAGCTVHLAQLTLWEHGSAEDYVDSGGGGWYGYGYREPEQPTQPGTYEMEEVYDWSLSLEHWTNQEGQNVRFGQMLVDEDEVIPVGSVREVVPEEEFEGYMGNYGMTLERWYRHGAIVLWPTKRNFEILCECGTATAIAEFCRMVAELPKDAEQKESDLKEQCIDLAFRIIETWRPGLPLSRFGLTIYDDDDSNEDDIDDCDIDEHDDWDHDSTNRDSVVKGFDEDIEDDDETYDERANGQEGYTGGSTASPGSPDFIDALEALAEVKVNKAFLDKVISHDSSVELTLSFLGLCLNNRISAFQPQFEKIFRSSTLECLERNGRLFEHLCSAEVATSQEQRASVPAYRELHAALKRIDNQRFDWESRSVNRTKLLVHLVRGLIISENSAGLEELVFHILSDSKRYPISPVLIATMLALKDWRSLSAARSLVLSPWLTACMHHLECETARKPQKPDNFARDDEISCKCSDCKELKAFLRSPTESACRFPLRKDRRRHLHQVIEKHSCDLDHVTERKGRPYTLVCTKNCNSFHRKMKQFHDHKKDLAELKKLEEQLA
ncbi:MAG: 2OG-Fe(II) oxygenase [Candidatus Obscuribacterales bacterium]|nr:2OG-Fe(II) oxygenase [Candidatus Obscuribacterales bacterium]